MLGICFRHNRGVIQTQWSYLCSMYNITLKWERMCGDEPSEKGVIQIETAADLPKEPALVLVSPKTGRYLPGEVDLKDFKHPENAIYMFGGDKITLSEEELGGRKPDYIVYIPQATEFDIHSPIAAGIVLYDRHIKRGIFG